MVREEQTGSVTSRQLDQFGVGANTVDKFVALGVTVSKRLPASAMGDDQEMESELARLPVESAANT